MTPCVSLHSTSMDWCSWLGMRIWNVVPSPFFDLTSIDVLFIENVGNLICPTHWSLGEHIKICLLSTPEGHDKPVKYPEVFAASNAILLNKIDLMDRVDFDRDFFYQSVRALNPRAWLREKQRIVPPLTPNDIQNLALKN